jgi:hypothetical protein
VIISGRSRDLTAASAERRSKQQRHSLAACVAGARPVAPQPGGRSAKPQKPKPTGESHRPRYTGIKDGPLIVASDLQRVQSDRLVILCHEGDVLKSGRVGVNPKHAVRTAPAGAVLSV